MIQILEFFTQDIANASVGIMLLAFLLAGTEIVIENKIKGGDDL